MLGLAFGLMYWRIKLCYRNHCFL